MHFTRSDSNGLLINMLAQVAQRRRGQGIQIDIRASASSSVARSRSCTSVDRGPPQRS